MTDERIVRIATLANVTVERTRYYVTFPWPRDDERLAWLSLVSDTQLAFIVADWDKPASRVQYGMELTVNDMTAVEPAPGWDTKLDK